MTNNARYDDEYITLGQVKEALSGNTDALNASINSEIKTLTNTISKQSSVFTDTPTPSYKRGDLWISGSTTYVCTNDRKSGSYVASDWKPLTDKDNVIGQINASGGGLSGSKISDNSVGNDKISGLQGDKIKSDITVGVNTTSGITCSSVALPGENYTDSFTPGNHSNQYLRFRTNGTTLHSTNSINILTGIGNLGDATDQGILIRSYQGHITLDAGDNDRTTGVKANKYVYACGYGVSKDRVATSSSGASSRNTKTNITLIKDNIYDKALDLLDNMNMYTYTYKYDLYQHRDQYGFILDEIEELDKDKQFFDIYEEDAVVNGDHIDFSCEQDGETIEVKKYNEATLDKYMLLCIKGLQQKIKKLEDRITELEKKEEK